MGRALKARPGDYRDRRRHRVVRRVGFGRPLRDAAGDSLGLG
jgi:hypothetical protein